VGWGGPPRDVAVTARAAHSGGAHGKEIRLAKARALGTGGPAAAQLEPANRVKLEPPTRSAGSAGQYESHRAYQDACCPQMAIN
jgi:hypothetical protein